MTKTADNASPETATEEAGNNAPRLKFSDLTFRDPTGGEILEYYSSLDDDEMKLETYARAAAKIADVDFKDIKSLPSKDFFAAVARGKDAFFPGE